MAAPRPKFCVVPNALSRIISSVLLPAALKESMMVYTIQVMIIGVIMGKVTFQKDSQAVAPSMEAASYTLRGMDCSAARKITVCTPESITISLIRPTTSNT